MIRERQVSVLSGGLMLLVLLAADAGLIAGVVHWVHHPLPAILCALGSIVVSICLAGLFIIKHMHNLSDEPLCDRWVENPYFQYFCGGSGVPARTAI